MSATMSQIAEQAGVSVGAVSRLLRNDPTLRISDQRREKILEIERDMGGLKMQRRRLTHTIIRPVDQSVSSNRVNQVFTDPISPLPGFQKALEQAGFHFHLVPVDLNHIVKAVGKLIEQPSQCDGLLVSTYAGKGEEISAILQESHFPHVSHDYQAEQFDMNTVNIHRTEGVRRALEHLKDLHHRRIGFLGLRGNYSYANYVAAMALEGLAIEDSFNGWIEPEGILPTTPEARAAAHEFATSFLATGPQATAFVCQNDQFALGLVDAMTERGLKPGIDLSVVGFDNIEPQQDSPERPAILTTISNPLERRGQRMAELLLNQILHKQTQIIHERIPTKLVVRSSTGICPAS